MLGDHTRSFLKKNYQLFLWMMDSFWSLLLHFVLLWLVVILMYLFCEAWVSSADVKSKLLSHNIEGFLYDVRSLHQCHIRAAIVSPHVQSKSLYLHYFLVDNLAIQCYLNIRSTCFKIKVSSRRLHPGFSICVTLKYQITECIMS